MKFVKLIATSAAMGSSVNLPKSGFNLRDSDMHSKLDMHSKMVTCDKNKECPPGTTCLRIYSDAGFCVLATEDKSNVKLTALDRESYLQFMGKDYDS